MQLLYFLEARNSVREIKIYGSDHSWKFERVKMFEDVLKKERPDVLIVEGTVMDYCSQLKERNLSHEDVFKKYGDQGYFAFLAQRNEIPVESWDLSFVERSRYALDKGLLSEVILAYHIFIRSRRILQSGVKPSEESIKKDLKSMLSSRDLGMANMDLDEISQKYSGLPIAELTLEKTLSLISPKQNGVTNDIIRIMNEARDDHAIKVIQKAKEKYKKILVTAGALHLPIWEPAIKALYKRN